MRASSNVSSTTAAERHDSADSLLAEVRAQGLNLDRSMASRIEALIARTTDDGDLGTLYLATATLFQGDGDSSVSAGAAQAAASHFVAAGRTSDAASASVMAAVLLDQCGQSSTAVELAVDALVMLGDSDTSVDNVPADLAGVRASLGLAGFFMRQGAFDVALTASRRAFEGGRLLPDGVPGAVAFSFGYIASEAAHVTKHEATRDGALADIQKVIDLLELRGSDGSTHDLLTSVLKGEIRHARGRSSSDLDLDEAESLYPHCSSDLVAWHRLVRGTSALLDGRPAAAIELLDSALPGLELSSDDHCIVRCLRARSRAHALVGDHRRAHIDSLDLADRIRRWQIDQIGHFADQLARRAELERSTAELRDTATRLADDIDRDSTTGVHSRRWLERHLDALSESSGRAAVIMFDVDRFKAVNDTYGHHIGDAVLRDFAMLLEEISGSRPGGVVARFGGEEFTTVLDDVDSAADLAERIRVATEAHDWSALADGLELSVSCGVAGGPAADVRRVLVRADQALLDAKRLGRNRVVTAEAD